MKYILGLGALFLGLIVIGNILGNLDSAGKYLPGRSVDGITKDAQSIGMTVFRPSQTPPVLQCSQTKGECRVTLKIGLQDGRPFNFNCVVSSVNSVSCTSAVYDSFLSAAWLCDDKEQHPTTANWVRRHANSEGDTVIGNIRYFISQNAGTLVFHGSMVPASQ